MADLYVIGRTRSNASNYFVHSNTGIVGPNPIRIMDVCPRFIGVMLSFAGIQTGRSSVQGVLLTSGPVSSLFMLSSAVSSLETGLIPHTRSPITLFMLSSVGSGFETD
jgi:hypothetical protein